MLPKIAWPSIERTYHGAPHVLGGILYNKGDLPLEEHYSDTHL